MTLSFDKGCGSKSALRGIPPDVRPFRRSRVCEGLGSEER